MAASKTVKTTASKSAASKSARKSTASKSARKPAGIVLHSTSVSESAARKALGVSDGAPTKARTLAALRAGESAWCAQSIEVAAYGRDRGMSQAAVAADLGYPETEVKIMVLAGDVLLRAGRSASKIDGKTLKAVIRGGSKIIEPMFKMTGTAIATYVAGPGLEARQAQVKAQNERAASQRAGSSAGGTNGSGGTNGAGGASKVPSTPAAMVKAAEPLLTGALKGTVAGKRKSNPDVTALATIVATCLEIASIMGGATLDTLLDEILSSPVAVEYAASVESEATA